MVKAPQHLLKEVEMTNVVMNLLFYNGRQTACFGQHRINQKNKEISLDHDELGVSPEPHYTFLAFFLEKFSETHSLRQIYES